MDVIYPGQKNVYILGAGFSRSAGLPLVIDFLANSRKALPWLESKGRTRERDAILKVFDYRQKSAAAGYYSTINLENIEELFSLATSDPESSMDDAIKLSIAATIDYCSKNNQQKIINIFPAPGKAQDPKTWIPLSQTVFAENLEFWKPEKEQHYRIYEYDFMLGTMFNLFAGNFQNDSIITFNYDLLIEKACERLRLGIDYAIRSDNISKNHLQQHEGRPKIRLLKIHGSLNWVIDDGKVEILPDYEYISKHSSHVPFLIPPTWRKDMVGPLQGIWRAAIDDLKRASRIIFIGFSIPDTDVYIKYLLTLGLKENVHLNSIIFVNPLMSKEEQALMINRIQGKFGDQIFRLQIFQPYWLRADQFLINYTNPDQVEAIELPLSDRFLDLKKYRVVKE